MKRGKIVTRLKNKSQTPKKDNPKSDTPELLKFLHELVELGQNQEVFRRLVEYSSDVICIIDSNVNIIYVSPSSINLLGYESDELIGKNGLDFCHPDDLDYLTKRIYNFITNNIPIDKISYRFKHKNGSWILLESCAQNYIYDDYIKGIILNSRDMTDENAMKDALSESENRYRYLFNNNPYPMWVYDLKSLRFLDVNNAAIDTYGYSRDEFLKMRILDIRPISEIPRILQHLKEKIEDINNDVRAVWKHMKKDGTLLDAEIYSHNITFKNKPAKLVIANNVTRQIQIQEKAAFRAYLLNNVNQAVISIDLEGRITYMNKFAENFFGKDYEAILGTNVFKFFDNNFEGKSFEKVIKEFFENTNSKKEFILKNIQGDEFTVNITSSPIYNSNGNMSGIVCVFNDITERKDFENKLKASEEKFRTLIENSSDIIALTGIDGKLKYISPSIEKVLGYKEDYFIEHNILEFTHPDDIPKIQKKFVKLIKNINYRVNFTSRVKNSAGTWKVMEGTAINLLEDPNVEAIVSNFRDVTERKKAEIKLENSVKEKELLIKEIHHRVKNNMQVISSILSLQSYYVDDERSKQLFRECQTRIKSMAIVHEKLYKERNLAEVNMLSYIESVVEFLSNSYSSLSLVKISYDIDKSIKFDVDKAINSGLIINELVSNAFKYAFPKGEGEIKIKLKYKDNKYNLTLEDTGIGFPENVNFRKTDSLGLQLVCLLVSQLGGTIELYREKGTKFEIIF